VGTQSTLGLVAKAVEISIDSEECFSSF